MALFGRKKRNPLEMDQYQMPSNNPMPAMAPGGMGEAYNVSQPMQKKRSVLPYILAAAEDTLARQAGYQPGGVARLNEQAQQRAIFEQRAMEQAARQQAEALARAEERQFDREDFVFREDYKAQNERPKPGSFEWWNSPERTPEERAAYTQYSDIVNPVMTTTWQGPQVLSRASLEANQRPMPGAIQDGYMFKGGDPADERNWQPIPARRGVPQATVGADGYLKFDQ